MGLLGIGGRCERGRGWGGSGQLRGRVASVPPPPAPPADGLIDGLVFAFLRRPLCGAEGAAAPALTRAGGGWAMAEISDLDRQIEQLRRCELIKESEVKALCAKAR